MFNLSAVNEKGDLVTLYEAKNDSSIKLYCQSPSCGEKIFLKSKNEVSRKMHFSHYPNSVCTFFNGGGGESSYHQESKQRIKKIFESGVAIIVTKKCCSCDYNEITKIRKRKNYSLEFEYKYEDSNNRGDVAILKNGVLKYIIEVLHTHKTKEENRLNCDWFEFKTTDILNFNIDNINTDLYINCDRVFRCDDCKIKLFLKNETDERNNISKVAYTESQQLFITQNTLLNSILILAGMLSQEKTERQKIQTESDNNFKRFSVEATNNLIYIKERFTREINDLIHSETCRRNNIFEDSMDYLRQHQNGFDKFDYGVARILYKKSIDRYTMSFKDFINDRGMKKTPSPPKFQKTFKF